MTPRPPLRRPGESAIAAATEQRSSLRFLPAPSSRRRRRISVSGLAALTPLAQCSASSAPASRDLVLRREDSRQAVERDGRRRVALVVGNAAYDHFGALDNPVRDAVALHARLRAMGFETALVQDAGVDRMRGAVERFTRSLAEGDLAVVYYSGHGVSVGGHNYLVPVDFDAQCGAGLGRALETSALSVDELLSSLGSRGSVNVLVMDACRNNPCVEQSRSLTRDLGASRSVGSGLARVTAPNNTVILYATQPGNTASDGYDGADAEAHSPFAAALLRHLPEPEQVTSLAVAVRIDVNRMTQGRQTPWQEDSLLVRGLVLNASASPTAERPEPTAPETDGVVQTAWRGRPQVVPAGVREPLAEVASPTASRVAQVAPAGSLAPATHAPSSQKLELVSARPRAVQGWDQPPYQGRLYFGERPFREEAPYLTANSSASVWVALTVDGVAVTALVRGQSYEASPASGGAALSLVPPRQSDYGILPLARLGSHSVELRCFSGSGASALVQTGARALTVQVPSAALTLGCD